MLDGLRTFVAKAATQVLGLDAFTQVLFPGFLGNTGPRLGATQVLRAYNEMPWLRSLFGKISTDIAGLTWVLDVPTRAKPLPGKHSRYYRRRDLQQARGSQRRDLMLKARAAQELTRLDSHPALDFLGSGNAWFEGGVSMALSQTHVDLIGEMAWFIETNGVGMPLSYIPFPPTWVIQRSSPNWPYYRVMGPWRTVDVPAEQILFAYHPDPSNPFLRGTGFGQVMGDDLETDAYAAKFTKDWFKYKAIPPILISGLGIDLPEMERVEQRWLQKTQGRGRGWLPHFMSKDVKVHQLTQTFSEQELGPLRKFERDMFRQIIGMPPEIMGITENSNKATSIVAQQIYGREVIVPRAEFLRAVLQHFIINRYDSRLILDYLSPVAVDKEFQLSVMEKQPHAFMQDEWRALADHDALPDGDGQVHMIEFKWRPVSRLGGQDAPAATDELPLPAPTNIDPEEDDEDFDDEGLPKMRMRDPLWTHPVIRYQERAFGPDDIANILMSIDPRALISRGDVVMHETVLHFGENMMQALDIETDVAFNVNSPEVQNFLRQWGGDRITTKVNRTTRKQIGRTLATGLKNGETTKQLRARIQKVFAQANEVRAMNIARTEVGRASNFGTWQGMKQGAVEAKGWLATEDDKVRDTHAGLNGTIIPVDEPFISASGAIGMFPGDFGVASEDCNCRCGILPEQLQAKGFTWKALEAERAPWDAVMTRALRAGFAEQRRKCLAAFDTMAGQDNAAEPPESTTKVKRITYGEVGGQMRPVAIEEELR